MNTSQSSQRPKQSPSNPSTSPAVESPYSSVGWSSRRIMCAGHCRCMTQYALYAARLIDGTRVLAGPTAYDDLWDRARKEYRQDRRNVLGAYLHPVIPKQNKWGTRYFAHFPGTDCQYGETLEHEKLKDLVYRQA